MSWLADLEIAGGERALDVATGSGTLAHELAERFGEVVAVDLPRVIERVTPHPRVRFEGMDAEALTLPDASFDLVAISWSLHHLANPTGVLDEMNRVLKPGGVFLIVEPFVATTGTNRDLHLAAHQLLAEVDRAHGVMHQPIFERLQVGSVIQGLGLVDLHFAPVMDLAEDRDLDLAACIEAGAPWVSRLDAAAADETLAADLRERARRVAERIRSEGLRTSPAMRTYGTKPA